MGTPEDKDDEELISQLPISDTLWKPASVKEEPETYLQEWRVYSVDGNFNGTGATIHLVGFSMGTNDGRVSAPVLTFNKKTKHVVTQGGRNYKLHGESGFNKDAMFVFNRWLTINKDPSYRDVTEEYEDD